MDLCYLKPEKSGSQLFVASKILGHSYLEPENIVTAN